MSIFLGNHILSTVIEKFSLCVGEKKVTFLLESKLKVFTVQKHRSFDTFYTGVPVNNQFIYRDSGIFLAYLFQFTIIYSVLALSWKYLFLNGVHIACSCSLCKLTLQ